MTVVLPGTSGRGVRAAAAGEGVAHKRAKVLLRAHDADIVGGDDSVMPHGSVSEPMLQPTSQVTNDLKLGGGIGRHPSPVLVPTWALRSWSLRPPANQSVVKLTQMMAARWDL